jgi:glutathionylspermidine synthase
MNGAFNFDSSSATSTGNPIVRDVSSSGRPLCCWHGHLHADARPTAIELRAGEPMSPHVLSSVRRRAVLEGCKWDPQVADVSTLTPYPLLMRRSSWRRLAGLAERLAAETLVAEAEIVSRPELLKELGLPGALLRALAQRASLTPTFGRVMRFDFHPTTDGWRISEVNSDVPGGFTEASHFTEMMAAHCPGLSPAGAPASLWCNMFPRAGVVALLSAPGYMEDHQVIAYLAAKLRERGCEPHLANPRQIVWRNGIAHLEAAWYRGRLDAIVRFYQAEWLARLPRGTGWAHCFRGGRTPVVNPGCAIVSESKRFPLVWDYLSSPMSTWRELLPETRDPREVAWTRDPRWLLKAALCNTGDSVTIPGQLPRKSRLKTRLAVGLAPRSWVAQRRFDPVPIPTPAGPRHVCLGIYTINGRAGGAYVRISEKSVTDFEAADVALLIEEDDE